MFSIYSGIGLDTAPINPDSEPLPDFAIQLHEVELRRRLEQEYNSPQARAQRLVQFRERHRQTSRLSANFESPTDQITRINQEILSELHRFERLEIRSNNTSIPKGVPIAKIVWTDHWADLQPHVTIPDSAEYNYTNLELKSQQQLDRGFVAVGKPVSINA